MDKKSGNPKKPEDGKVLEFPLQTNQSANTARDDDADPEKLAPIFSLTRRLSNNKKPKGEDQSPNLDFRANIKNYEAIQKFEQSANFFLDNFPAIVKSYRSYLSQDITAIFHDLNLDANQKKIKINEFLFANRKKLADIFFEFLSEISVEDGFNESQKTIITGVVTSIRDEIDVLRSFDAVETNYSDDLGVLLKKATDSFEYLQKRIDNFLTIITAVKHRLKTDDLRAINSSVISLHRKLLTLVVNMARSKK
ncbi:MAG: hypothetical protein COU31_03335 [Candidatus Magasanikbacteria bacterium CG10_big_fil_rev_8_21_14_0_10_40_10]|uniref:Uncharacterized protein n=1 Tax=Candidatus Magasanikbacteria bacterium CG10_big_fil_rev_8_21_14_0_10_40_10 TaxID=1974648 RepID=A0A2M6W3J7_9BACT|nr:MAG: hypothetical protein COU31_03335 [Candidatus Magasanikbacteria bacterium CG10_big_fil_rev_8_21_14_0_10_40_10]